MLSKSERQTIQEVIEACRIHEKAVANMVDAKLSRRLRETEDVTEGLAISATKLETLLGEKFNPKASNAVLRSMEDRRMSCSWTTRFIDEAIHCATQSIKDKVPVRIALEDWTAQARKSIVSMRIDARPIPAVIIDANDQDALLYAIGIVRDALVLA
jgi:hypothetical protein